MLLLMLWLLHALACHLPVRFAGLLARLVVTTAWETHSACFRPATACAAVC
jgi:hypothetical protein